MSYSISTKDGVLLFTINRSHKMNAVNYSVMEGLEKLIAEAENDALRYVVLTGEGDRAFCSGGDLTEFHTLKTEEEAYGMLSRMAAILYRLATLPVPVIALVNGSAVGGGCEIATACDFRIVSSEAKCGFIQGSLGITSGWGGGTYLLEKIGPHHEMLRFLCEATPINAEGLRDIGWASMVYEGDRWEALYQFIRKMEAVDGAVLKAYKEIAVRRWEQTLLRERVMEEVKRCAVLWEGETHERAVASFLSKRK